MIWGPVASQIIFKLGELMTGGQWLSRDPGSVTSLAENMLGASDFRHLSRDLWPLLHWLIWFGGQ